MSLFEESCSEWLTGPERGSSTPRYCDSGGSRCVLLCPRLFCRAMWIRTLVTQNANTVVSKLEANSRSACSRTFVSQLWRFATTFGFVFGLSFALDELRFGNLLILRSRSIGLVLWRSTILSIGRTR